MVNKYVGAGQAVIGLGKKVIQKLSGQGKTTGKEGITSVKPGKNLTKKRFHQDDVIKTRDKIIKEYGITDPKVKTAIRTKANQPKINKKIADIQDRARVKKMGGGMMGRRMGYSEGKLAVTPREKQLAAQYGDKKRITRGDVITAAKKKDGEVKKLMTPKERAEYVKKAKVSLGATAESLMDKNQPKKRDRLFQKYGK